MAKLHHELLIRVFRALSRNEVPVPFERERVGRILLVNTTAIGDTLLSTPAIRAVRLSFPEARITALVSGAAFSILKGSPRIDDFMTYPGRLNAGSILRLPGLVKRLRERAFDLVVVLHANDPDIGPLAYLSKAPWRMGWSESRFSFLFTMPVETAVPGTHGVDIKLKNLDVLGVAPCGRALEMFLSPEDEAGAQEVLREIESRGRPFAVLHPFGSKPLRWWPIDNAGRFSSLLSERLGVTPVVIGDEKVRDEALTIALAGGGISAAGRLKLRSSAALLKRAAFMVSTDSGPMHMAQALGVPTVALFGPEDAALTGPLNENSRVVQKRLPCLPCRKKLPCLEGKGAGARSGIECMAGISPEEVISSAQEILSVGLHTGP